MILSFNHSGLGVVALLEMFLKEVPLFMYQIRADCCGLIPNWVFMESVAGVCFADEV